MIMQRKNSIAASLMNLMTIGKQCRDHQGEVEEVGFHRCSGSSIYACSIRLDLALNGAEQLPVCYWRSRGCAERSRVVVLPKLSSSLAPSDRLLVLYQRGANSLSLNCCEFVQCSVLSIWNKIRIVLLALQGRTLAHQVIKMSLAVHVYSLPVQVPIPMLLSMTLCSM